MSDACQPVVGIGNGRHFVHPLSKRKGVPGIPSGCREVPSCQCDLRNAQQDLCLAGLDARLREDGHRAVDMGLCSGRVAASQQQQAQIVLRPGQG